MYPIYIISINYIDCLLIAYRRTFDQGEPPAPLWATAAAVGPGGERGGKVVVWGHTKILYKAPEDYTEPKILYKAPKHYTRTYNTTQRLKISNTSSNTY